jgi:anti-sigma factor RsiW
MTHEQAVERLDDFASGELPDIERVQVQRHLDACAGCRDEVAELRTLLAAAAGLPRGIAPSRDLWASIAPRLEPRADIAPVEETRVIPLAPRRRPWQPPRWALQAAAAVVLVVGSSTLTRWWTAQHPQAGGRVAQGLPPVEVRRTGEPATGGETRPAAPGGQQAPTAPVHATPNTAEAPATALVAFRPAERDYQRAIRDLQRVLETRRSQLAPETVETLERNLTIIDAAIAESRAALERDPNSRELTRMLTATYDAKVKMLRQAVEI